MIDIKHIPRGAMCIACVHTLEDCSKLPFSTYRPMGKVDDEGYLEVRCERFSKEVDHRK